MAFRKVSTELELLEIFHVESWSAVFLSPLLAGVLVFLGPFTAFQPEREREREWKRGRWRENHRERCEWCGESLKGGGMFQGSGKRWKACLLFFFFFLISLFIKCLNECAFETSWGNKITYLKCLFVPRKREQMTAFHSCPKLCTKQACLFNGRL